MLQLIRAMADFSRARWRWVNVCVQALTQKKKTQKAVPKYISYILSLYEYVLEIVETKKFFKKIVPGCRHLAMIASWPVYGYAHGGH